MQDQWLIKGGPRAEDSGLHSRLILMSRKEGIWKPTKIKHIPNYPKIHNVTSPRPPISPHTFLVVWVLKDGNIHISTARHHRRFLTFEGGRDNFQLIYLPFRLSAALRVSTECLIPVAAFCRTNRIHFTHTWMTI